MKKVIAMLLAAAMVIGLVACGQKAAAPAETTAAATEAATTAAATTAAATTAAATTAAATEAPAAEKTPVTLQVSIVETDFQDTWDNDIVPKFQAEYPWITLEAVGVTVNKGEFHQTRAAANDLPPVMQTDNNKNYWDLVDAGLVLDLSGTEAAKNIPQGYKDTYTHSGKVFGLTQGAAFGAVYYNMDLLGKAGWTTTPKNWDEFIKCCDDVKKSGVDALTFAGSKSTTLWMPLEAIIVNCIGDELGEGGYEKEFRAGTLDLTKYPVVAQRWQQLVPYVMEGTTTIGEDDVTAYMTDGTCAIAIAGNWTSTNILNGIAELTGDPSKAVMEVIPFNDEGKTLWVSATPESAFGMSKVDDPAIAEARDIFFEWIFTPENFRYIQNARGTFPVLTNMSSDLVVLSDAQKVFSAQTVGCTPFSMNFNNISSDCSADLCTWQRDVYTGAQTAETAVVEMAKLWAKFPRAAQ